MPNPKLVWLWKRINFNVIAHENRQNRGARLTLIMWCKYPLLFLISKDSHIKMNFSFWSSFCKCIIHIWFPLLNFLNIILLLVSVYMETCFLLNAKNYISSFFLSSFYIRLHYMQMLYVEAKIPRSDFYFICYLIFNFVFPIVII